MITVTVRASKQYDVIIGAGVQKQIGTAINHMEISGVAIISDTNVWPLYGNTIEESLNQSGITHCHFVFPAGENSKNGETYLKILSFLAENHITRSDAIIALGGGVVGDIAGFAAATYLRGISYIQVPTTLLAMVDSSVGGKTAIDLPEGKNLTGAFYQPSLVLGDLDALNTLNTDVFRDGCAEIIKYGVLYDTQLFEHLEIAGLDFAREQVISRCITLKRDVVNEDEFDKGSRQKLNLGHTLGHSIEANSNFTVSHGQGVAMGMVLVSKAGCALGICSNEASARIQAVLNKFGLPVSTDLSPDALYEGALSDKKRSNNLVNLIIPKTIGDCIIYPLEIQKLKFFIEAGL